MPVATVTSQDRRLGVSIARALISILGRSKKLLGDKTLTLWNRLQSGAFAEPESLSEL